MNYVLKNAQVYLNGDLVAKDILVKNGKIEKIDEDLNSEVCFDLTGKVISPSFVDLHVHTRTPGFEYKETLQTLEKASVMGGFTDVVSMPNLNPVPDSFENLELVVNKIKDETTINIAQSASITSSRIGEEKTDFKQFVGLTNFVSDDGSGVESNSIMHDALLEAKELDLTLLIHPEYLDLVKGGHISVSDYAKENNMVEILPEAEELMIGRDLILNQRINAKLHFCHVSTKNGADLILKLGTENTTFEVAPHHLVLSTDDLTNHGHYKMNPPLRSKEDVDYLVNLLASGDLKIIATDHAPHSKEEKDTDLVNAFNGIIGLETCFPLLYTELVSTNRVPLKNVLDALTVNPGKIMGLDQQIKVGNDANLVVLDLENEKVFSEEMIGSKSHNTPFIGKTLKGNIVKTIYKGNILFEVNDEI